MADTSSVSSVASTSSTSNTSSSSSTKLTATTKAKLEALGVDTTNITSEAEGQIALKLAQSKADAAQQSQSSASSSSSASEDSIKSEAKSLASSLGVSVSDNDTTDDILNKISSAIGELRAAAGNDQSKLAEVEDYESQYESISGEYSNMQTSQAQLSNSMSGLASYNKIYQNLS